MSSAHNTQTAEILIRFSVLMLRLYPHLSPTEKTNNRPQSPNRRAHRFPLPHIWHALLTEKTPRLL